MNQTRVDRVRDAATKRRAYLRKKAAVLVLQTCTVLVCVGSPIIAVFVICWLAQLGLRPLHDLLVTGVSLDVPRLPIVVLVILALLYTATRARKQISEKSRLLSYVPPVRKQIAALPAEEVLLRGSDQPGATPEELLRAAQFGGVLPVEELVRAEQSATGRPQKR